MNTNKNIPLEILEKYKLESAAPVNDDLVKLEKSSGTIVIRRDILSGEFYEKSKSDKIVRSLLRHDPIKLARVIISL